MVPDAGNALSGDRFKREIAVKARLQHSHILPVLSAGTTTDRLPFYTMPFVEASRTASGGPDFLH